MLYSQFSIVEEPEMKSQFSIVEEPEMKWRAESQDERLRAVATAEVRGTRSQY